MKDVARFLAIESSSARLSLAVGDQRSLLGHYSGPHQWRHAESLFGGLEKLLKKVRWRPSSLTGVAVSIGPGSFTGIRIGLAAARALGQTLRIPVVGISSLETLAHGARGSDRWVFSMVDGLRGALYGSLFERTASGRLIQRIPEERLDMATWTSRLQKVTRGDTVALVGDAVALYGRQMKLPIRQKLGVEFPRADILLNCARAALGKGSPESYRKVLPLYLRDAAAVERRKG